MWQISAQSNLEFVFTYLFIPKRDFHKMENTNNCVCVCFLFELFASDGGRIRSNSHQSNVHGAFILHYYYEFMWFEKIKKISKKCNVDFNGKNNFCRVKDQSNHPF